MLTLPCRKKPRKVSGGTREQNMSLVSRRKVFTLLMGLTPKLARAVDGRANNLVEKGTCRILPVGMHFFLKQDVLYTSEAQLLLGLDRLKNTL